MKKKVRRNKSTEIKLSRATLYVFFIKHGAIIFSKGEKVPSFLI
jgi:hypothetical protein